MENGKLYTLDEQIEFIDHELKVKEDYIECLQEEPLELETGNKEKELLHAVRLSLVQLDLLNKIQAESAEPVI